jgi:hypothetical protein
MVPEQIHHGNFITGSQRGCAHFRTKEAFVQKKLYLLRSYD